jgi:hypothetical protein
VRLPAPNVGITIYTNTVKDNRKRRAVAEVLAEQGLIDPRLDDDRKKDRPRHSDNIREAVKKFLMSPDTPFPLHNLSMGSVLEALRKNIPDGKSAYNRLRVEERLRATLGPTTPQEERLFGKLLVMTHKGTEFAAVVDKIRLGNTEGSARVIANVRREGFFIHVNISGAPLAMSDEAPKPIISYSFNATRPLFDRDNLTTEQATQKAKDLLEILELF